MYIPQSVLIIWKLGEEFGLKASKFGCWRNQVKSQEIQYFLGKFCKLNCKNNPKHWYIRNFLAPRVPKNCQISKTLITWHFVVVLPQNRGIGGHVCIIYDIFMREKHVWRNATKCHCRALKKVPTLNFANRKMNNTYSQYLFKSSFYADLILIVCSHPTTLV